MISEREENGLALDALRGLYHVGMMTQNQVGAVGFFQSCRAHGLENMPWLPG